MLKAMHVASEVGATFGAERVLLPFAIGLNGDSTTQHVQQ